MKLLTTLLLIVFLASSALAVVAVRHDSRKLFAELQGAEKERDLLSVEWGRLQLEQAAWADSNRVEHIAKQRLDMQIPSSQSIQVVVPRGQ